MAVSSPRPAHRRALRAGAVKTGLQAPAKRLGLDGPEHGAMLTANRAFTAQAPVSWIMENQPAERQNPILLSIGAKMASSAIEGAEELHIKSEA